MTDCVSAEMRDALPDLIHGRLEADRAAEVEEHIASCAECAAELELLRNVFASAPSAPSMNVGRIASAIPAPARAQRSWVSPLIRIAAVIAVVSAGALAINVGKRVTQPSGAAVTMPTSQASQPIRPAVSSEVVTVRPGGPKAEQLHQPVKSPTRVADVGLSLVGEVDDLSDERLVTLINEMDRMDAIPSAEPEAISPVVGDAKDSGANQ